MNKNQLIKISKKLSYVLRHKPEAINITLDAQGWVEVKTLLEAFNKHFFPLTQEALEEVVANNNKKRFAFSEDKQKIRASQGHSIPIELGYKPQSPPEFLYHGTASHFLKSIQKEGLVKQNRHHVHLSKDEETAHNVGTRHGVPVILKVKAKVMETEGFEFFVSENGVWLTEQIPTKYLLFPSET